MLVYYYMENKNKIKVQRMERKKITKSLCIR